MGLCGKLTETAKAKCPYARSSWVSRELPCAHNASRAGRQECAAQLWIRNQRFYFVVVNSLPFGFYRFINYVARIETFITATHMKYPPQKDNANKKRQWHWAVPREKSMGDVICVTGWMNKQNYVVRMNGGHLGKLCVQWSYWTVAISPTLCRLLLRVLFWWSASV